MAVKYHNIFDKGASSYVTFLKSKENKREINSRMILTKSKKNFSHYYMTITNRKP